MKLADSMLLFVTKQRKIIFLFFCLALIIHVLFAYNGSFGNDDLVYAYYAAKGVHFVPPACVACEHFSLRWLPVFSTAFFYKVFGINDISSALFSLICFLLTAFILYFFLKKEKPLIFFIALILFFFNRSTIFYAHRLLADAGICAFNFCAYYFYHKNLFSSPKKTTLNGLGFSISLILAALTKETIIILFPLWLLLFITDVYKNMNHLFWIKAILMCFVFTAWYLLYFHVTTGDWLYRYHLLQKNNTLTETYLQNPEANLFERIGYGLWKVLLLNGDMEYLLFAITGLLYYKTIFKNNKPQQHILFCFLILLLSSNFMSFTFTAYMPLWADPRHFLFLIPFAVLTGVYMLNAYMENPGKYMGVLLCFFAAEVFLMLSDINGTKYIYYCITLILLVRWLIFVFNKSTNYTTILYLLFVAVMSVNYFYDFFIEKYSYYYYEKKIIVSNYNNTKERAVVFVGDRITTAMGAYFLSFDNSNVHFANIDTCKFFYLDNTAKNYLLVNTGYNSVFKNGTDSLIKAEKDSTLFSVVSDAGNCILYKIKNPSDLIKLKKYSTSDF